ncbi:MAG TPA: HDOD domain-containing protein [Opitutales bacterium]|nr:HDOD domain-containing protein [Opitutales bacterium]
MTSLEKILEGVVSLPPTPKILPKLQKLLRDPDSGIHEIISLIKVDAPMTAQIVRLSNSAFYSTGESVQSLEEAVNRLGFKEVYRVASVAAAQQVMGEALPLYNMGKGELLESSVSAAVLMVELGSRSRRVDLDAAYTTGLLHSIGKVVINQYFLKHGLELYGNSAGETVDIMWERRLLGFDNADAGAAILTKWNFPEEIVQPVKFQLDPLKSSTCLATACQLAVARTLAPSLKARNGILPDVSKVRLDPEILEAGGLDTDKLIDAVADARAGLEEMDSLFK